MVAAPMPAAHSPALPSWLDTRVAPKQQQHKQGVVPRHSHVWAGQSGSGTQGLGPPSCPCCPPRGEDPWGLGCI